MCYSHQPFFDFNDFFVTRIAFTYQNDRNVWLLLTNSNKNILHIQKQDILTEAKAKMNMSNQHFLHVLKCLNSQQITKK